jgi:acetyl-CoA carboxylase biotin carboxylase subunit/propionyl-CoA carboxylase alpha chain
MADSAVHIGEAPPAESYLNMEKMIASAIQSNSDAVHPGWGFLAENHKFAKMVIDAGLTWIGPPPEVIKALGDKIQAKNLLKRPMSP